MTYDEYTKNLETSVASLLGYILPTDITIPANYSRQNAKFVLDEIATKIGVSGADSDFLLELDGIMFLTTLGMCYYYSVANMHSEDHSRTQHYLNRYESALESLRMQMSEATTDMP